MYWFVLREPNTSKLWLFFCACSPQLLILVHDQCFNIGLTSPWRPYGSPFVRICPLSSFGLWRSEHICETCSSSLSWSQQEWLSVHSVTTETALVSIVHKDQLIMNVANKHSSPRSLWTLALSSQLKAGLSSYVCLYCTVVTAWQQQGQAGGQESQTWVLYII